MRRHSLQRTFEPASVAVIGASPREDSVGFRVLHNLLTAGFKGPVYPVNRNHPEILGHTCYPSILDIADPVDLVVLAIPAERISGAVRRCVEKKVGGLVVISAGFGEVGPLGRQLQDDIVALARSANIPLVGPNCLGVMRPSLGLNATFARSEANAGRVALVSQSGAFCAALLDAAHSAERGFSLVASLGATADVGFGEVLDYLSIDYQTRSVLLYIESVFDARAFLSGLRAAARLKPVVVVKPGRHEAARRAAVTHTGGQFGSDEVFNAALERAGAVRVHTVSQLIAAANLLSSQVRVTGSRLAIITNGGGPGVMAADHAGERDVPLAQLDPASIDALSAELPPHWSHSVPVDLLGDADRARYETAVRTVLADRNVDGLLVLLTPQGTTDPTACAEGVIAASRGVRKPVLACWMGEDMVREGRERLEAAGIPHFNSPEGGVDGFGYLAAYQRNQDKLLQAPPPLSRHHPPRLGAARALLRGVLEESRKALDTIEAREILSAFHIPVSRCVSTEDPEAAQTEAESMGLPVVMKINSPDISHKSEVGGVRLNVREAASVPAVFREIQAEVQAQAPQAQLRGITLERMELRPHAREAVVRIDRDPVFGPVIRFGSGGIAVDVHADTRAALPPLNVFLCNELIQRTRVDRALHSFGKVPEADRRGLVDILMRVSEMACELPEIEQLVINPVLVDEHGALAVDAWITVSPPPGGGAHYSHMAIHPYPPGLESTLITRDGVSLTLRPIRPEDADIEQRFVDELSAQSKYFRFMYGLGELSPAMLARFTQIDYDREMALVAVQADGTPDSSLKAVVRYVANPGGDSCEFALAVADDWQQKGIGSQLMERLMDLARQRGFIEMDGEVLTQNSKMLKLCRKLGFQVRRHPEDGEIMLVSRPL